MTELDELKKHTRLLRKILKTLLLPYQSYGDDEFPDVPEAEADEE